MADAGCTRDGAHENKFLVGIGGECVAAEAVVSEPGAIMNTMHPMKIATATPEMTSVELKVQT